MPAVNPSRSSFGALVDLEVGATGQTAADTTQTLHILDLDEYPDGFYVIDVTLVGYAETGFTLSGTLSASVGGGTALSAAGGAFTTQLTPHLPVLVRLDGSRTAVVVAVADNDNATLQEPWLAPDVAGVAGKAIVRTYQTATMVLAISGSSTEAMVVSGPTVTTTMNDAGGLTFEYGAGGVPKLVTRVVTSAGATSSGVANTATTNWTVLVKVRAMVPTFV